jgi:hypothetical protein
MDGNARHNLAFLLIPSIISDNPSSALGICFSLPRLHFLFDTVGGRYDVLFVAVFASDAPRRLMEHAGM